MKDMCVEGQVVSRMTERSDSTIALSPATAMYDTIIIGAGMSGLAAGIRLAYYDQRVCILERHTTIGGLNSFYRLRGRDYDVGLHAVTNFTPKGDQEGPARPAAAAAAASAGTTSPSRRRSARRSPFPACGCDFNNDFELLASEDRRAVSRAERQLPPAARGRSSTTTT